MKLVEKAKKFAKEAHTGQKRWDGSDYFENHCRVVANYVSDNIHDLFPVQSWKGWFQPDLYHGTIAAAYLHDVLEDTTYTLDDFPIIVKQIVECITRRKDETYLDYIVRIQNCGPITVACRAVKIADLRCNMENLKEGSLKDKYRFAEEILTRGLSPMVSDIEYHMRKVYEASGPSGPLFYMKGYYKDNPHIYEQIKKLSNDIRDLKL